MDLPTALERLRELAACEPLAAALLHRLPQQATAELSLQAADDPVPVYVRYPKRAAVRFRNAVSAREPLQRMLALFAADPRPRTVAEIARATGLIPQTARNVLNQGEHFQRDGLDSRYWSPRPQLGAVD